MLGMNSYYPCKSFLFDTKLLASVFCSRSEDCGVHPGIGTAQRFDREPGSSLGLIRDLFLKLVAKGRGWKIILCRFGAIRFFLRA